ncbi:hypothetical protein BKA69DRAFT_1088407 [Paraphysoderma sedebokerense]|nr:hypothetical protein BKA69DRAFT_1088407 [Paraphysoderma sedebokerense]
MMINFHFCLILAFAYLANSTPVTSKKRFTWCGAGDGSTSPPEFCLSPPSLSKEIEGRPHTLLGWSGHSNEFRLSLKMLKSKKTSSGPLGTGVYIYESLDTVRGLMKERYRSPEICATYLPTSAFKYLYKVIFPREYSVHDEKYGVTDNYEIPKEMQIYLGLLIDSGVTPKEIGTDTENIIALTSLEAVLNNDDDDEIRNRLQMKIPLKFKYLLRFQCVSIEDSYQWQEFPTWNERSQDPKTTPFSNEWVFYNKNPPQMFFVDRKGKVS